MNTQKIKFTVGNVTKEFEVKGIYPYLINPNQNKVVLRMTISEEDATYDDIYSLKTCTGIIDQYDRTVTIDPETQEEVAGEWTKKTTYENYNSGEISIAYQNGQYSVDLTRVGRYEQMVEQNKADIEYISIMADIPLE